MPAFFHAMQPGEHDEALARSVNRGRPGGPLPSNAQKNVVDETHAEAFGFPAR